MYLRESYRALEPYLKKYRKVMILGALSMVITDMFVLLAPYFQALAIRSIENQAPLSEVFLYSFSVFFVIVIAGVFRYLWRMLYLKSTMLIGYALRRDFFRKLLSFSPHFFEEYTTGDIMARATNDLQAVRAAIGPGVIFALDIIILGSSSVVIMFIMDWQMALYSLIPLPFIGICVRIFDRLIHRYFEKVQAQFSRLSEKVRENISGIRVIKTFVQEKYEIENFRKLSYEYVQQNMKLFHIEGIFRPVVMFFSNGAVIIIMIVGLSRVIDGKMDLGSYWAFNEYLWLVVWPMAGIGWIVGMLQRGTASMKRLGAIMERMPKIQTQPNAQRLKEVEGAIEFENVWFRFEEDGPWVLRNINLSIKAGQKIGIVGKIGAGKSALTTLLLRFSDPQKGTIRLDGKDIRALALGDLRSAYGFVPQETFLFSDTIRENIVFGIKDFDDGLLETMSKRADLYNTIAEFPHRFDTLVGEKGVTLSGGQKQRTAIARALIVDPAVIVLDDAFSNLDSQTERQILSNLHETWIEKTVLMITHRLTSLQSFDSIIVVEDGEIVEQGTHDDLMQKKGLYFTTFNRQRQVSELHQ